MIDLEKIQGKILHATPVLGRESVPILEAIGRVLVYDIHAVEDFPPEDISAMDGYAVRSASLEGAGAFRPVRLQIVGESSAGMPWASILGEGEAVRIMTGAMIPDGGDTVVKLEDAEETSGYVLCRKIQECGAGIRAQGESLKTGEVIFHRGDMVDAQAVGTLASLKRPYVCVHRRPTVALISTGNELSDFHEPPSPGKIMSSNIYALAARVIETGGIPWCLGIVRDDLNELGGVLKEALAADILITSGGTSNGRYDLMHQGFASLGMETRFSSRFKKPGKPTVFGVLGKTLIFGLPGNPVAALLSFDQFIKMAMLKMMGFGHRTESRRKSNEPFADIDSFNHRHGGNKNHQRAPQIPLETDAMKVVACRQMERRNRAVGSGDGNKGNQGVAPYRRSTRLRFSSLNRRPMS